MKKARILIVMFLALASFGFAQEKLTDKELVNVIYAMGQMYPDGFTLDLNTMRQPTEGLIVSYKATQNSFDRKSLPAVIKHARAHNNLVGGWYNPEEDKYYFDSNRSFPEDSLAAAVQFARDNEQHTVYVASKDINIWTNYEQKDIRVILDCDMGSSTDDLFALMMLYRYMDMKRCNLIGVIVDRMGKANADIVDVMNNFYGYPDIPIGLETDGQKDTHVWITYHNRPYARSTEGVPMPRGRIRSSRSSRWAARRSLAASVSAKWKCGRWKPTALPTPCRKCSPSNPTTCRVAPRFTNPSSRATTSSAPACPNRSTCWSRKFVPWVWTLNSNAPKA